MTKISKALLLSVAHGMPQQPQFNDQSVSHFCFCPIHICYVKIISAEFTEQLNAVSHLAPAKMVTAL